MNRVRRLRFDTRKQRHRGVPITNNLDESTEMVVCGPPDEGQELSDVASVGDEIDVAEGEVGVLHEDYAEERF